MGTVHINEEDIIEVYITDGYKFTQFKRDPSDKDYYVIRRGILEEHLSTNSQGQKEKYCPICGESYFGNSGCSYCNCSEEDFKDLANYDYMYYKDIARTVYTQLLDELNVKITFYTDKEKGETETCEFELK